ncbi:MAG: helix-turn-helix transcriptional regulator [Lachnospiraceae bacterium]|nr:helix-turn-helix transcriptional regulator [Lachnospiraceae bacterium]
MDYSIVIWSVCLYVENRVKEEIDLEELAVQTGFSLPHVRQIFRRLTGKTLLRYIQERKIANAAWELLHTDRDIVEVAVDYGFSGRDVFTRVFRRITGYTPREFRKERPVLSRVKLCAGVFGIGLVRKSVLPR